MKGAAAERALEALIEGNRRFVAGTAEHPRSGASRRAEVLEKGQYPFAAIVGCADSRVPPELVFDQGLGDLFVVRTAGTIVDDLGLASLAYAVEHLGVPLIVVMGHSRCGAVTAATEHGAATEHLACIISALAPSVESAREHRGNLVDNAARENVKATVARLRRSEPVLKRFVDRGVLRVAGAFYELETGAVALIE